MFPAAPPLRLVAVPVNAPINVVAVTTPVNLPSPTTVSFDPGVAVPIPTLSLSLIMNLGVTVELSNTVVPVGAVVVDVGLDTTIA